MGMPMNPLYSPDTESAPRYPTAVSASPPLHAPRLVGCLLPRMLATLSSQLGDHLLHGVLAVATVKCHGSLFGPLNPFVPR